MSVAMATYNGSKYIRAQLESILKQTIPPIEIIIVDDKSSDSTPEIISEFASRHSTIRYKVNTENLGVSKNFENAISMCRGDFVALSDQDDIWEENKLELLLNNIGDNDIIYTDAIIIDSDGKPHGKAISDYNILVGIDSNSGDIFRYLAFNSFIWGTTMMIRRDTVASAFPILATARNHDWWLACIAAAQNGITFNPAQSVRYRMHGANYSIPKDHSGFIGRALKAMTRERRSVRKRNADEIRECILRLSQIKGIPLSEKIFLDKAMDYAEGVANNRGRLSNLFFSLRYGRYVFARERTFKRIILSLSKFIGT